MRMGIAKNVSASRLSSIPPGSRERSPRSSGVRSLKPTAGRRLSDFERWQAARSSSMAPSARDSGIPLSLQASRRLLCCVALAALVSLGVGFGLVQLVSGYASAAASAHTGLP